MIFQQPKISRTSELLNDLAGINNDRIAGYQTALDQAPHLSTELRDAFCMIISDGASYRHQLIMKIKLMSRDMGNHANVLGKIYMAWNDLKVVSACHSQKSIVSCCMYNEEIALHVYRFALSDHNSRISEEIFKMISNQERGLRENHGLLKGFRDVRQPSYAQLKYLV